MQQRMYPRMAVSAVGMMDSREDGARSPRRWGCDGGWVEISVVDQAIDRSPSNFLFRKIHVFRSRSLVDEGHHLQKPKSLVYIGFMAKRRRGAHDLLHIHVQVRAQQKVDLKALATANRLTLGQTVELLISRAIARRKLRANLHEEENANVD